MVTRLIEAYWLVVRDCLVEFHGFSVRSAGQLVGRLRASIESQIRMEATDPGAIDIFFHNEAFDVACSLAQHQLDQATYQARYMGILSRRGMLDPIEPTAAASVASR